MKSRFNYIFSTVVLILLLCQGAGQVFCGDRDCLNGNSAENCATLLCSLLGSHTEAPYQPVDPAQDQGKDCHCVCHVQFNQLNHQLLDLKPPVTGRIAFIPLQYSYFLFHRIDHPPSA